MAKKELNLLQFASTSATQPSAGPPQVVRRELGNANLGSRLFDHVPDQLFGHSVAPRFTGATHATEESSCFNARALYPFIQLAMDPIRNGNRPNVTGLTAQVHDCPMPFALLQVIKRQFGGLVASEATSKQEGEERTVPFALEPFWVWGLPQSLPLFCRQPVAQPDAEFLHTLDAPYSRCQIGAQEAALCRFIRQSPNGAKPEVDCTWREVTGLEMHPITDDHSLAERQPWLGAVPVDEFVNCMAIAALRVRAGKAVENRGLRDFKIR